MLDELWGFSGDESKIGKKVNDNNGMYVTSWDAIRITSFREVVSSYELFLGFFMATPEVLNSQPGTGVDPKATRAFYDDGLHKKLREIYPELSGKCDARTKRQQGSDPTGEFGLLIAQHKQKHRLEIVRQLPKDLSAADKMNLPKFFEINAVVPSGACETAFRRHVDKHFWKVQESKTQENKAA